MEALLFHKHVYGNALPPRYQSRAADFVYSPIYGDYYGIESTSNKKPFPLLYLYTEGLLNSTIAQGRRYGGPQAPCLQRYRGAFPNTTCSWKTMAFASSIQYIHGSNAKCGSHAGGCNNNKKVYIKDLIQMNSRSDLFGSDQFPICLAQINSRSLIRCNL